MIYNRGLFVSWIPRPMQFVLMFFFAFVLMGVNSVYPGNAAETYSSKGLTPAAITSLNNAMYIGQGLIFTLVFRVKMYLRSITKLFLGFILLALLSLLCTYAQDYYVLVFCSFILGAIKMLCLHEFLFLFMTTMVLPGGNLARIFYLMFPALFTASPLGAFVAMFVSYGHQWERTNWVFIILLLICALLVRLVVHNKRFSKHYPLYYIDWFSIVLVAGGLLLMNHVLSFVSEDNWFLDNALVQARLILSIVLLSLGLLRQRYLKRPIWPLNALGKKNVLIGYGLIFFLGILQGAVGLETVFISTLMKYDQKHMAILTLWMIPGSILSGVVGFYCIRYRTNLKELILAGFTIFVLYYIGLYINLSKDLTIEFFYAGYFIRSLATGMIYIGVWYFLTKGLVMAQLIPIMSGMQIIRTFLSVMAFTPIYSYLMYSYQLQSVGDLAVYLDMNTFGMLNLQKYSDMQQQALMVSLKKIFGWVIIFSLPILSFVLWYNFGKVNLRRLVYLKSRFLRIKS